MDPSFPRVASLVLEDKGWVFREAENRIDLIVFSIRKGRKFRRDFQGMLEMCVRLREGLIACENGIDRWKLIRHVISRGVNTSYKDFSLDFSILFLEILKI